MAKDVYGEIRRLMAATWIPCQDCENYWCVRHQTHVHDCDCLPIEGWTESPYKADS
jgi:hypothetical protein